MEREDALKIQPTPSNSSTNMKYPKSKMKDVTYGQFVCTVRPKKAEPNRTRFTVRGNRIN